MLGNIIGGFIVILVGVTLAPVVADEVTGAQFHGGNTSLPTNITGASSTILGLTTLFYNLSIAATAIGIAAQGLRNSGLM
jgi:xanthine/uracil permease